MPAEQPHRTFSIIGAGVIGVAFAPLLGGILFDVTGHHHLIMWGTVSLLCVALAASFAVYARRLTHGC